ncbi:MAG: efflux RND transporter periplasmic adaptor subunit [Betaproteobacteria bacterium]|nr:efflux RND transporter periplasmic adaptor subunit [Betaproteobacteria bacterium]
MASAFAERRTITLNSHTGSHVVSKRLICLIPAATLAALLLAGCQDAPSGQPPPARPILTGSTLRFPTGHPQLGALKTVAAEPARPVNVDIPARVIWDEDRTQRIYPAFAGRISTIRADVGSRVAVGQVLAELASPEFGVAQADASRARADLVQANRQLDRVRDLHAIGIAARKELEQAETDALRAQTELDRTQARTQLYGGSDAINQRLAITAGITGVVVERNLNPGQELRPEQFGPGSTALFVLTDPTHLWLQVDVREGDLSQVAPGRRVEFIANAYPDRSFPAEIMAVGDAIDPLTRTLKVRARVDNTARLLKVEMLGRVRVSQSPGQGAVVPASAVVSQDNTHWIYVSPNPGEFEPRQTEITYLGSERVLIREALRTGEQVLVENTLLLARIYRGAADANERTSTPGRGAAR